ncbi:hypothetical protein EV401DRAFT_2017078 [Pisolithus croceorrhizus]|nr:hypothetical protein EV401DRAFT_2017078 [Pisolithus croceorrhizus]
MSGKNDIKRKAPAAFAFDLVWLLVFPFLLAEGCQKSFVSLCRVHIHTREGGRGFCNLSRKRGIPENSCIPFRKVR